MIETVDGWAVERMLRLVLSSPEKFRRVMVCVPFIDDDAINLLVAVARRCAKEFCKFTVITGPNEATRLHKACSEAERRWLEIKGRNRLHAKIYLVVGHRLEDSEAIVTSANLTKGGLRRNQELGMRIIPTTVKGRKLYNETSDKVMEIGAKARKWRAT